MSTGGVDILIKARKLLSDKKRWTRGAYCRDAAGRIVRDVRGEMSLIHVRDNLDTTKSFCMMAAISAVLEPNDAIYSAVQILNKYTSQSIAGFNDTHTHAEVLAFLDRAIEENR